MRPLRRFASAAALAASAIPAFAHGGSYAGPASSGGGAPPPGPADEPAPVTSWETWWASNKYLHLELGEGMREAQGAVTPSARDAARPGEPPPKTPAEIRRELDALVRDDLAPIFVRALSDPSFEVRTAAAVALGKTGLALGVEPLRRAAREDTHQDVRDSALLGLGLLGRPAALPFLQDVLRDETATTRHRSFAAFSIGFVGGEDAASSLVEFMRVRGEPRRRGDPPLLASCFLGMGFARSDAVLPTLREAATDRAYDDATRAFVWLALGRAGDRGSRDLFAAALDDPGEKDCLRRAAAIALGRVATAADGPAVAALFKCLHGGKDPLTRHFAAVSLGGMADPALSAELRAAFPKAPDADKPFLALALGIAKDAPSAPLVRRALATERNNSLRGAYAITLGLLRDVGAREVLEAQVRDRGSSWPRGYAALAIGMARLHPAAPVLREEMEATHDPSLRANLAVGLGLLQDAAARKWFFATIRGKGSIYERGGAAMALGLLRIPEAVPDLVALSQAPGEQDLVRAYAVVALGILADPSDPPKLARFSIDHDYSLRNDPLNEVLTIY